MNQKRKSRCSVDCSMETDRPVKEVWTWHGLIRKYETKNENNVMK